MPLSFTSCSTCDQDFTFDNGTSTCNTLSTTNGKSYNTQNFRFDVTSVVDTQILSISDGVNSPTLHQSVNDFIAASTNDGLIKLFPSYSAVPSQFHQIGVALSLPLVAYKYSIKISGTFSSACLAN